MPRDSSLISSAYSSSSSSSSSSRLRGSSARSSSVSGAGHRSFDVGAGSNAGAMTPIPITINSRATSVVRSESVGASGAGTSGSGAVESKEELVARFSASIRRGVSALRSGTYREQRQALWDMHDALRRGWATPLHGREVATSVGDALRDSGGLEILVGRVEAASGASSEMRLDAARVLEAAMTAANREFVVNSPKMNAVVSFAVAKTDSSVDAPLSRVATGLLGHLFKHSEDTCHAVIKRGALDAVVRRCAAADKGVLRQCAVAFANLAMYGGEESQQAMVRKNVPEWLFHLAFSTDDVTRYYACLAICALVANKEFEAAVAKSGTLSLVDPFIESHDPAEFAVADVSQIHGQSEAWLKRLLPVLESTNREAQSLAAFHFAMEANIKGAADGSLKRLGAVDALKRVASCPNDAASKLAAKALRALGEDVPHRLPQQVQLWSSGDVRYWVENVIDFPDYAATFAECKVDGDLLLQMTEEQLLEDIGMTTGLHRRRFARHLTKLKTTSDYSSCDHSRLDDWLLRVGAHLTRYTYALTRCGILRSDLSWITDDQLREDVGIENGIHRKMILQAIEEERHQELAIGGDGDSDAPVKFNKSIDVFISYRRSNGSQLASLLKVHLQLRNFVVFIDIEKLEAGKFDENLLNSVRSAKHFLLVLTPNALDRCVGDEDQNDWVHKEIATALTSGCNIIPITDDFAWPQPDSLPEDMRKVCFYNGVKWIHDYQDACIAKIIRFIKGDTTASSSLGASSITPSSLAPRQGGTSLASGSEYQAGSLKDSRSKWSSTDADLHDDDASIRSHINGDALNDDFET